MKLKNEKDEIIELKGEVFDLFERVEEIREIIILGVKGGVRRILIEK